MSLGPFSLNNSCGKHSVNFLFLRHFFVFVRPCLSSHFLFLLPSSPQYLLLSLAFSSAIHISFFVAFASSFATLNSHRFGGVEATSDDTLSSVQLDDHPDPMPFPVLQYIEQYVEKPDSSGFLECFLLVKCAKVGMLALGAHGIPRMAHGWRVGGSVVDA